MKLKHIQFPCSAKVAFLASLLLAGCGGGSTSGPAKEQQTTVGQITATYSGKLKPNLSVAANSVSVSGVAGAAFSTIDFYPTKNVANAPIVFDRGQQIWEYLNGVFTLISNGAPNCTAPNIAPNGKIAFMVTDSGGNEQIATMNGDGSGMKVLTTTGGQLPSWSPDGKRIAYNQTKDGEIFVMNADGTGQTSLTSSLDFIPLVYPIHWSTDGSAIIFTVVLRTNQVQIMSVSPNGGPATNITPQSLTGLTCVAVSFSPDGSEMLMQLGQGTAICNPTLGSVRIITPTGFTDTSPTFSPDGRKILVARTNTSTGATSLVEMLPDGENSTNLVVDTGSFQSEYPFWGSYQSFQRFIGSGGSLGSGASGFLFSQSTDAFSSFFAFTAKTPSTASIASSNTGSGSEAPLVFSIHADSLTRFVYVNSYLGKSTVINPTADTDVLVSFSSVTGQVTVVAPLAEGGTGALKPAVRGSNSVYQTRFSAVYDAHGKNLAEGGASQIEINPKTGDLVSLK